MPPKPARAAAVGARRAPPRSGSSHLEPGAFAGGRGGTEVACLGRIQAPAGRFCRSAASSL
jgi:hypothetical protein